MTQAALQHIPTNIITGFLGVGKSTALRHLLMHKPAHERWAVLVNEFGEVGIDGGLISGSTPSDAISIKEVPGGCMCCAAGVPMQIALTELLRRARPHRLLIEPTGLGHPKEFLGVLAQPHFKEVLRLQRTITLVDARHLASARHTQHATFREQLEVADLIVASKSDCYGPEQYQALQHFVSDLGLNTPIKQISCGELPVAWLEGPATALSYKAPEAPEPPPQHKHAPHHTKQPEPVPAIQHFENTGQDYVSKGWIFAAHLLFDRQQVLTLFKHTSMERAKGILITPEGIFAYNKSADEVVEIPLDEHLDSRVEVITQSASEYEQFEHQLMQCLISST